MARRKIGARPVRGPGSMLVLDAWIFPHNAAIRLGDDLLGRHAPSLWGVSCAALCLHGIRVSGGAMMIIRTEYRFLRGVYRWSRIPGRCPLMKLFHERSAKAWNALASPDIRAPSGGGERAIAPPSPPREGGELQAKAPRAMADVGGFGRSATVCEWDLLAPLCASCSYPEGSRDGF